ncbi:MAG: hypothetical protein ACOY99_10600 [Pseudomonadota bacterium]
MHHHTKDLKAAEAQALEALLAKGVRLNTITLGLVIGLASGAILFLGTHLSLAVTGEKAGQYLDLLAIFLPGYSASPKGAWMGFLWGFVFGGLSGSLAYLIYARNIKQHFAKLVLRAETAGHAAEVATLRLSGNALGIAFGCLVAAQLFLTTLWLAIRPGAGHSPHAALLANYLPGYKVSVPGAIMGAVEVFVVTYLLAYLFAWVYNLVAARRGSGTHG